VKATSSGNASTGETGATQLDAVYLPVPGPDPILSGAALSLLCFVASWRRSGALRRGVVQGTD
jgi:hypothetical protein